MTPGVLGSISLIEWLIFGFIGVNVALVSVCLVHDGVKRFGHPTKD